jgi:tellurite resistance-related uncharacterized protein
VSDPIGGVHCALIAPASVIPEGLRPYKRTPEFTTETIPAALLRAHSTKEGVWGRIHVLEGELVYGVVDARREKREVVLAPTCAGVIEPTMLHEVQPRGGTRFFVEFFRSFENQPSTAKERGVRRLLSNGHKTRA